MDSTLTDEQREIRDWVRTFVRKQLLLLEPEVLTRERAREPAFPPGEYAALGDLGGNRGSPTQARPPATRDLRVARAPATAEDLAALQADVLAGFVLARAAAGLPDETIASDVLHVEQVRAWSGRPLRDMEPADADAYFGTVLRGTAEGTRLSRARALKTCFVVPELRHKGRDPPDDRPGRGVPGR